MPHQEALTVLARVRPGQRAALEQLLGQVSADLEGNSIFPFQRLTSVHFARFVILDEDQDLKGRTIPATLVFASCVDAPLDAYLRDLARLMGQGLDQIYSHCEGYPGSGEQTEASRVAYLRARMVKSQAFYVNTVGRTAPQVRQEARLREAIGGFLDEAARQRSWSGWDAPRIRQAAQEFVRGAPELGWATPTRRGAQRLSLMWRLKERAKFFLTVAGLVALLPLFLLSLPVLILLLHYYESRDFQDEGLKLSSQPHSRLGIPEDQVTQNQFSAVGYIKPSLFRRAITRILLWGLDFACRHVYNNGDLGSVGLLGLHGVNTIHFAQWVVIDQGRRVLFMSNYDGSLVSYMDDFINKVAWGLNAVFSNGVGYPKTRWLFLGGATDERKFKAFLHKHQKPTQVWYSGYKHLSAMNIGNNAQLRKELFADLNGQEALRWLQRL